MRKLCEQKGAEIIEAEACPDYIHMLVSIPPYISIARFMGYHKGKKQPLERLPEIVMRCQTFSASSRG